MPVEFDGDEAIQAIDDIITKSIPDSIEQTLSEAADKIIRIAQDLVPVQTGNLQSSISILQQGDDFVIVGSDVEYAAAVEFGTSKRPERPYLRPAFDEVTAEFADLYIDTLESHMPSS